MFPLEIGAAGTVGSPKELGAIGGTEGVVAPEIGALGTAGTLVGLGAIGGAAGTAGIDNDPVVPEVLGASELFGTSLSFGMSLGGVVVGVVGATTGAPGVAQGLTGPQLLQEGFLQLQDLILSNRLG